MPEDDPESFQLLLHWFYGHATGFTNCEQSFLGGVNSSILLKLYALASKYMLRTTHDAIISCMYTRAETTIWLEAGFEEKEAWNYYEINTMEQCQMDKLLLDWVVDGTIGARQPPVDEHHDMFDLLPEMIVRAAFKTINQITRGYFNPGCKGRGSAASYFWENEEAAQGGKTNPRRGIALINAPHTSPLISRPATPIDSVEGGGVTLGESRGEARSTNAGQETESTRLQDSWLFLGRRGSSVTSEDNRERTKMGDTVCLNKVTGGPPGC